jgi:phosphoribosylformylglycinamidine (FGAM) synthase PurS component
MIIEIWTRDGFAVNEKRGLIERLAHAGLPVKAAGLSRLYNIDAAWPARDFRILAAELLSDRITERYSLSKRPGMRNMYRVEVWLKNSATDVIGESVREAVRDMLGRAPRGVRFGRAYYVSCGSEAKLRAVVAKTLANEVVNVFTVTRLS